MSNINDIIATLTEAGAAIEKNKTLEASVTSLQVQLDEAQRHAQQVELSLRDRSTSVDELEAKIRSLEVERDNALFRTLELEDAFNKAGAALASVNKAPTSTSVVASAPTNIAVHDTAPIPDTPTKGKYEGRYYSQLTPDDVNTNNGYPILSQWIDGGGTEDNFWR